MSWALLFSPVIGQRPNGCGFLPKILGHVTDHVVDERAISILFISKFNRLTDRPWYIDQINRPDWQLYAKTSLQISAPRMTYRQTLSSHSPTAKIEEPPGLEKMERTASTTSMCVKHLATCPINGNEVIV